MVLRARPYFLTLYGFKPCAEVLPDAATYASESAVTDSVWVPETKRDLVGILAKLRKEKSMKSLNHQFLAILFILAGGAAGTAIAASKKGQQLQIPSETLLEFRLQQPVSLPVAGS